MEILSESRAFDGRQLVLRHRSEACSCDMTLGLFLPREAAEGPVPVLWVLAGLTCTHETAMSKAGAQAHAAAEGIALVFPDTSPRGAEVPDDADWAMGQGAGFYLNATWEPWARHFRMWDHLAEELPGPLFNGFALDPGRQAVTGHSMGGHGALTLAMGLPGRFRSVSAFAPICNPTRSDWGRPQFTAYLGEDDRAWAAHDATLLMAERGFDGPVLVDTGTADQFGEKLGTAAFARAVAERGQEATIRLQKGYDHSYFFVSSFMGDHVAFHARALFA